MPYWLFNIVARFWESQYKVCMEPWRLDYGVGKLAKVAIVALKDNLS